MQKKIFIHSLNNKDQYNQNNIYFNKTQIEIKYNLNLTHDNIEIEIVNENIEEYNNNIKNIISSISNGLIVSSHQSLISNNSNNIKNLTIEDNILF